MTAALKSNKAGERTTPLPHPVPLTPRWATSRVTSVASAELRQLRAAKFSEKRTFNVGNAVGKSKPQATKAAADDGGVKPQVGASFLLPCMRARCRRPRETMCTVCARRLFSLSDLSSLYDRRRVAKSKERRSIKELHRGQMRCIPATVSGGGGRAKQVSTRLNSNTRSPLPASQFHRPRRGSK